jgi:hypothetical protein
VVGVRSCEGRLPNPGEKDSAVIIGFNGRVPAARRKLFLELPFGSVQGYAPIGCDSNDPQTQIDGITKRMARKLPTPDLGTVAEFSKFVDEFLKGVDPVPVCDIPSVEEWLEETPYPLHRKEELYRAYVSRCGFPTPSDARNIQSFMKTESYPEFKCPRGINSRSDAFKVYSGPYFKAIENVVYKWPQFVKHIPVADRPRYIHEVLVKSGARYFGTDFTSFEASFSTTIMRSCELKLYRHMLSSVPTVADYICSVIGGQNHGSMRCGVSYKLRGRRMSGDMCTSLGNGFTNLMILMFLLKNRQFGVLVEGDDGLVAVYDQGPLPRPEDYARLGFVIKIEIVDDPMLASFCGIICPGGVNMKDPTKVFQTFGWTSAFMYAGVKMRRRLLRAKALSLAYEMPSCPVVTAIARRALELTRGAHPYFVYDGYHNVIPPDERDILFPQIADMTRIAFEDAFGVPVAVQQMLERRRDVPGVHAKRWQKLRIR